MKRIVLVMIALMVATVFAIPSTSADAKTKCKQHKYKLVKYQDYGSETYHQKIEKCKKCGYIKTTKTKHSFEKKNGKYKWRKGNTFTNLDGTFQIYYCNCVSKKCKGYKEKYVRIN